MMRHLIAWLIALSLTGCASLGEHRPPIDRASDVDLDRFMGTWYVIAHIPTFIDRGGHNQVEHYALNPDGSIATTFSFNAGGFDGERKVYTPTGFVREGTGNAVWGMQFIWPIKAEYVIAALDEDYQVTIIARSKRDLVWLLARRPAMDAVDYQHWLSQIADLGYDIDTVVQVPQRWP
jgi:apolipoprotein D and lipocalin family protein